jgi:hypothetical protein
VLPSLVENGESERHHAPEEAQELNRCFFLHFACCLLDCCVRQCPEVGEYLRRFRRIHHALREEDADHSLYGIGVRRGPKATVPPESASSTEDFVALNIHRYSESPAAMDTEKDFGICALLRRELM